jgi:hypothetical protein
LPYPAGGGRPRRERGSEIWPRRSGELFDFGGQFAVGVAGVGDAAWLEEEQCGFGVGPWAVRGAAGHDEDLPWCQDDIAIVHLDGELSAEYQEKLVGVGVLVPGEFPWTFTILMS